MFFLRSFVVVFASVAAALPKTREAVFRNGVVRGPMIRIEDSSSSSTDFQITNACLTVHPSGNTTFNFTVHDPAPIAKQKAFCSGTWNTKAANYPEGNYIICGDGSTNFEWNIQDFYSHHNFTINVSHGYANPALGPPDDDWEQTFALAALSTNATDKSWVCPSAEWCSEPRKAVISAPIYGISA